MPKKIYRDKTVENLKVIKYSKDGLFANLSEDDKKNLLSHCSLIANNASFKSICDELGSLALLDLAEHAITTEDIAFSRGKIEGVVNIYETICNYSAEYLASKEREENFNPQEII